MSYYILYSLPPEFDNTEAIQKECYFAIIVKYIDGNTIQIVSISHIQPQLKELIFNILQPGNQLYLEQLKYLTRFHRKNNPWEKNIYKWESIKEPWLLNSKILIKRFVD